MSAGVEAVDAGQLVRSAWPLASPPVAGAAIHLLAVGKAAPAMARAFLDVLDRPVAAGLVIGTHRIHDTLPPHVRWLPSSHPVPDDRSVAAGRAARSLAEQVGPEDVLVVLLSGGASALMALPAEGLALEDKQAVTRRLLRADADIHALNTVRKHLSGIKGGRLAAACRGATITLAVSDVVGDDPAVIGSGPTVADASTFADAVQVITSRGCLDEMPEAVRRHLADGAAGRIAETPKPGAPALARSHYRVIGSAREAIAGARAIAIALGYRVTVIEEPVTGEARTVGAQHAARVLAHAAGAAAPLCVLSAGETTVRVVGDGIGGRNQEFALAAVPVLQDWRGAVCLASVGTDGIDGPTDAAGAIADSTTAPRAAARGLEPMRYLEANDAWHFFEALGDLVRTGRTSTNVGDLQVVLVLPPGRA